MTDIKQAIQELRPCPFCGQEPKVEGDRSMTWVRCGNQGCLSVVAASIEAWNTRSSVEGGTVERQCRQILDNIVSRIDPDNAPVDKAYISPTMILGVVTFEEIRDMAKLLNRWEDGVACCGGWILPEGSKL